MTIHKTNKFSASGKPIWRALLRAADSLASVSLMISRKSSWVLRPLFKAASLLHHHLWASLSLGPLLQAADLQASLSLTSSLKAAGLWASLFLMSSPPKSLWNGSVRLDSESCASSPDHITIASNTEVDPEVELGIHVIILALPFTKHSLYKTTLERPGTPLFIYSSSPTYLFSFTMADCVISFPVQQGSAKPA